MPALRVRLLSPAFILLSLIDLLPASPQGSRSPSPSGHDILTLRALVSTRDAGVIIGKGGKNVADLREQTGVKAGVSRVVTGIHERVLSISGTVESVAKVCSCAPLRVYFPPDFSTSSGICAHYRTARRCKPRFSHRLHLLFRSHFYAPLNFT
jgi:KH domain